MFLILLWQAGFGGSPDLHRHLELHLNISSLRDATNGLGGGRSLGAGEAPAKQFVSGTALAAGYTQKGRRISAVPLTKYRCQIEFLCKSSLNLRNVRKILGDHDSTKPPLTLPGGLGYVVGSQLLMLLRTKVPSPHELGHDRQR